MTADIKGPDAVLQLSEYGLLRIGSLSSAEADRLSSSAAEAVLNPGFQTALQSENLAEKWRRLSTGCHVLDHALGGGFPVRGITELAGESGCGKTQLCLQLCLSVQYPLLQGGLNSGSIFLKLLIYHVILLMRQFFMVCSYTGAVYICTEDSFPARRLQQLFHTYPGRRTVDNSRNFGDNIFVEHIADAVRA